MNLVLVIVFVETVIFIWLLKESILAVLNFNILEYLNNWFKDRPIILPSVLFLILPFLISLVIDTSILSLEESENNSSFFTWITTISTVAFTAFGLFLNNRYSEIRKNKKEQKELANILIPIVNGHLLRIQTLKEIKINTIPSDDDLEKINSCINTIQNDVIYQSCLSKGGMYESKIINLIIEYNQTISLFIDEFNRSLKRDNPLYLCPCFVGRYKDIVHIIIVKSYLVLMVLSKLIINDNQKYKEIKAKIVEEYCCICAKETTLLISDDFVVQTHGWHSTTLDKKELIELIIFIFKELGILNELKAVGQIN